MDEKNIGKYFKIIKMKGEQHCQYLIVYGASPLPKFYHCLDLSNVFAGWFPKPNLSSRSIRFFSMFIMLYE